MGNGVKVEILNVAVKSGVRSAIAGWVVPAMAGAL
jgi:hypothetical protein